MLNKLYIFVAVLLACCLLPAESQEKDPSAGTWIAAAASSEFPRRLAEGELHGRRFKPDHVDITQQWLHLVQGESWISCDLCLSVNIAADKLEDREFRYVPDSQSNSKEVLAVNAIWRNPDGTRTTRLDRLCGLRVRFLKHNSQGQLPGFIVIRLSDKSHLEGYFVAQVR